MTFIAEMSSDREVLLSNGQKIMITSFFAPNQ